MTEIDPRLTPARPDLAAEHLRGIVEAAEYVAGRPMHVAAEIAEVRRAPAPDAAVDTQALHGENLMLYEDHEGWAWVQLDRDGYVGYVSMNALAPGALQPTHRLKVNRSFVYPQPNMKLPPLAALPLGAAMVIVGTQERFTRLEQGGFVFADHVLGADATEPDFVGVAERLLGTPYLWGGKSSLGIDCSGLVQLALMRAGVTAPRDTDMQERGLGTPLALDDGLAGLQRGDLVFWKGHVGLMANASDLVHANAHHMLVACEPLRAARDRILASGAGAITSVRRL